MRLDAASTDVKDECTSVSCIKNIACRDQFVQSECCHICKTICTLVLHPGGLVNGMAALSSESLLYHDDEYIYCTQVLMMRRSISQLQLGISFDRHGKPHSEVLSWAKLASRRYDRNSKTRAYIYVLFTTQSSSTMS